MEIRSLALSDRRSAHWLNPLDCLKHTFVICVNEVHIVPLLGFAIDSKRKCMHDLKMRITLDALKHGQGELNFDQSGSELLNNQFTL